ncbi:ATP-grasp domain-containing protein [Christiangramia crocea]|uniref:ATP-grasp domain-containing protein n=1 Tax=Christiangramia crocea TaxID=2904124 RepID=A0A9X2A6F2_9FLAO|nr:ATP-grasp domain-containing protein [Gramella crocea]MCG9970427.1 ATP-grasp domain-containing protein [Gramella crocea]
MKKLLLLGGLRYLLPVIKEAKELGYYTITCDYLPENIAHQYSDEYHNISITDRIAVLKLAQKLGIDGIMSFAVDPGVLTAAYVAEKLGLPGCPLKSVEILQNKGLFRSFLKEYGFNVPLAKTFHTYSAAVDNISKFNFPLIVKPVDSAGSKGVSKVTSMKELEYAVRSAILNSVSNTFIVEEFIEVKDYASDSDGFSLNGNLEVVTFSNQYFNANSENPYTPSAYSWPSSMETKDQDYLERELQRLISLLNLGTSLFNIEVRVGLNGLPYIMEVSPRGGGNRLSEMVKNASGLNLIRYAIQGAMGEQISMNEKVNYKGNWCELILYSKDEGEFAGMEIHSSLNPYLKEKDLWVDIGDRIYPFSSANYAIGTLIFNFDTTEQIEHLMENRDKLIKINLS